MFKAAQLYKASLNRFSFFMQKLFRKFRKKSKSMLYYNVGRT